MSGTQLDWECSTRAAVVPLSGDGGSGDGGGGEGAVYWRVAWPADALTGSVAGAAACLGAL